MRAAGIRALVHRWPRASGILLLGTGLLCLAAGFGPPSLRGPGIVLGLPFLIAAVSILGRSGQLAASLEPLEGRTVGVEVRGEAVPGTFLVEGFQALGAGLWVRLRPAAGGHPLRLKIAQPLHLRITEEAWEVTFAGYVQWAHHRLPGAGGGRGPGAVRFLLPPGGG